MERGRQRSCRRELSWPDFCRLALQEARSPASPRAVLSSHPIGENDRTPPDRLLCPSLLNETAVLTILCTQESLRLGFQDVKLECSGSRRESPLFLRGSEPQPALVPPVFAQPFFQRMQMDLRIFATEFRDIRLKPVPVQPSEHRVKILA